MVGFTDTINIVGARSFFQDTFDQISVGVRTKFQEADEAYIISSDTFTSIFTFFFAIDNGSTYYATFSTPETFSRTLSNHTVYARTLTPENNPFFNGYGYFIIGIGSGLRYRFDLFSSGLSVYTLSGFTSWTNIIRSQPTHYDGYIKNIFKTNQFKLTGKVQKVQLGKSLKVRINYKQITALELSYLNLELYGFSLTRFISLAGFSTDTRIVGASTVEPFRFGDWYRINTINSYNMKPSNNLLGRYDITIDIEGRY